MGWIITKSIHSKVFLSINNWWFWFRFPDRLTKLFRNFSSQTCIDIGRRDSFAAEMFHICSDQTSWQSINVKHRRFTHCQEIEKTVCWIFYLDAKSVSGNCSWRRREKKKIVRKTMRKWVWMKSLALFWGTERKRRRKIVYYLNANGYSINVPWIYWIQFDQMMFIYFGIVLIETFENSCSFFSVSRNYFWSSMNVKMNLFPFGRSVESTQCLDEMREKFWSRKRKSRDVSELYCWHKLQAKQKSNHKSVLSIDDELFQFQKLFSAPTKMNEKVILIEAKFIKTK